MRTHWLSLLGVVILLLSVYFLIPNILEVVWIPLRGTITNLEKNSVAENSKYLGTVESSWFRVEYQYELSGTKYAGTDMLGGRSKSSVGNSPPISSEIDLIVNPGIPSQSMVKRPLNQPSILGIVLSIIMILGPSFGRLISRLNELRLEKSLRESVFSRKKNKKRQK